MNQKSSLSKSPSGNKFSLKKSASHNNLGNTRSNHSFYSDNTFRKEKEKILPENKYPFYVVDNNRFKEQIHNRYPINGRYYHNYSQREEQDTRPNFERSRSKCSIERYKENANSYRTLFPDMDLFPLKGSPKKKTDKRVFGTVQGSISKLIEATPYIQPYYKKKAGRTQLSSVFQTSFEAPKPFDREKLNRSYCDYAAGNLDRHKFDELKNFYLERQRLFHQFSREQDDYYTKKKLNRSNVLNNSVQDFSEHLSRKTKLTSKNDNPEVEINYKNNALKKHQNRMAHTTGFKNTSYQDIGVKKLAMTAK